MQLFRKELRFVFKPNLELKLANGTITGAVTQTPKTIYT